MYPWRTVHFYDAYGDGFACGCGSYFYYSVSEFACHPHFSEAT